MVKSRNRTGDARRSSRLPKKERKSVRERERERERAVLFEGVRVQEHPVGVLQATAVHCSPARGSPEGSGLKYRGILSRNIAESTFRWDVSVKLNSVYVSLQGFTCK